MKIQFRLKICDPRATLFYSTPRKDKAENGGTVIFWLGKRIFCASNTIPIDYFFKIIIN